MMIVRTLLSALALLFGLGILLSILEWAAEDAARVDSTDGSRPAQIQPCPETCLMP